MDTREKTAHKGHILEAFRRHGVTCERTKLYCGDYTLPADQSVCVDVKRSLLEVYQNLVHDHDRFRRECIRAQEAHIRLIILVEESGIRSMNDVKQWQNPREAEYRATMDLIAAGRLPRDQGPKGPPVSSARLARLMRTMAELYKIDWRFCAPEQTGEQIINILTQKSGPVLQRGAWSVG